MKVVSTNKLLFVAFGLACLGLVGFYVSEINPRGVGRSLASDGFSFDKELSDLASKRVIKEIQSGRDVELGSEPTELERFLFENLKGEFSLEVKPDKSFKLVLLRGKESTVVIENQFEFVKEALGFLLDDKKNYHLIEQQREPAASKLTSHFAIVDKTNDKVQAKVNMEITEQNRLKSLTARIP